MKLAVANRKPHIGCASLLMIGLMSLSTHGSVILTGSVEKTPLSYSADFSISGNIMTLVLTNTSSQASADRDQVLSSFYFDIVKGGNRPTLSLTSAEGDVYLANQNLADTPLGKKDLMTSVKKDGKWEFKAFDASKDPNFGFGVGTVGNGGLKPNSFNGDMVFNTDYSIYVGDVTTSNLKDLYLVKNKITFTFSGLTGFSEDDIKRDVVFGLGTNPDKLVPSYDPPTPGPVPSVPTPTAAMAGWVLLAGLGGMGIRRRMKQ